MHMTSSDHSYTPPSGFGDLASGTSIPDATAGNDSLAGGTDAETLSGLAGNDQLNGGQGDDVLIGGAGNDTYVIARGDGRDTVNNTGESASNDTLSFSTGVNHDQLWFTQSGQNLLVSVIGTTDQVTVSDWYTGSNNRVATISTNNGYDLTSAAVQNLVNAMSSMTPPPIGQLNLTTSEHTALDAVIAANWKPQ
ncbi:MAG: hypothetical protein OQK24_03790 [Magnetovibrio sp.]|nr:hypothetical protein [Magnetovibrio sp.]